MAAKRIENGEAWHGSLAAAGMPKKIGVAQSGVK
jgi:hypothetical protein